MPKTILIVDDSEIEREGLAIVLTGGGYVVAQAKNGQVALDYLGANAKPDVIVTDMTMPVMDGWRFMARKARTPAIASIPVIILTGLGVASADWASSLGACAFFPKPVDPDELVKAIEACP